MGESFILVGWWFKWWIQENQSSLNYSFPCFQSTPKTLTHIFIFFKEPTKTPNLLFFFIHLSFTHSTLTFLWWIYQQTRRKKIKQFSPSLGSKIWQSQEKKKGIYGLNFYYFHIDPICLMYPILSPLLFLLN